MLNQHVMPSVLTQNLGVIFYYNFLEMIRSSFSIVFWEFRNICANFWKSTFKHFCFITYYFPRTKSTAGSHWVNIIGLISNLILLYVNKNVVTKQLN